MSEMTLDELMPNHGDAMIVVRQSGQAAVAYLRRGDEIHKVPIEVTTDYDQADPLPLTPRRFTVRAGRNAKDHKAWLAAREDH